MQKAWGDLDAIIECLPPTIIILVSIMITTNFIYYEKHVITFNDIIFRNVS